MMSVRPPVLPRRMRRRLLKGLALLVGLPLFYLLAALAGSIIPANRDWRQPAHGVTIFVRSNGVHTWLLVPKVNAIADWRVLADPGDIRDRRYAAGDYLAFGFGNRDFYLDTPTWADLSVPTALAAAFGRGPGLLHVEHVWRPRADADQLRLVLRPGEYRRLAARIHATYRLDAAGRPVPLHGRGYGPADIFYEARGRYDATRTCNEWAGETLRAAGVRIGVWTPFAGGVMRAARRADAGTSGRIGLAAPSR